MFHRESPPVCDSADLFSGHAVLVYHVSPHRVHHGELLMADGTASLALVLLHVGAHAGSLGVPLPTDLTCGGTVCGREQGLFRRRLSAEGAKPESNKR